MSKYSVKRPFTVLVAVILILVAGGVSLTKMTPDLFPSMDMPYVVVMTPYPGAAPEKVEASVTKPLEQTLSTLTDIKKVQSVSDSNYSMIIMEFENDVNMDTISSDILQKINMIEGNWDDSVGTPTIMKINPDMIPVTVAAVDSKGMSRDELSNFVSGTLMNKLEGTTGVASISQAGVLEKKVNVVLSQKKIDKINNKILASVNSKLADAQSQLDEQKAKIEKGQAQVAAAQEKLDAAKAQMPAEMFTQQFGTQQEKLTATSKQLTSAMKKIDAAQVQLDAQAAEARKSANIGDKITTKMISGILKGQNFAMPAGYAKEGGVRYLVSVGDTIDSEKEAKNLYLFDTGVSGVGKIYLSDVADVFMSDDSADIYAKINGKDGVILSFSKQSNYATADVCKNITAKFDELKKEYNGLSFTTLMDQGSYIGIVVGSILDSLLWGALFSILILLLFLRGLKPTFITLVSIPVSLIFGIVMMYFSGITINLISMSGLAVSVGMLVDNSVVVIENTVRLRRKGVPAPKAAVAGAKQVAGAVTASTLTTICVFVPIIFTDGLTRELFTDMALTVGYTLTASLIIALTVVPAMSSRMLVNTQEEETKFFLAMLQKYKSAVTFTLRHKAPLLIVAALLLAGSAYVSINKGLIFMPDMTTPQIQATLTMPEGSTMKEMVAESDEIISKLEKVEDVDTVGALYSSGSDVMMSGGTGSGMSVSYYIMLNENIDRKSSAVAKEMNEVCQGGKGKFQANGSSVSDFTTAFGGSGVTLNIYGDDLNDLAVAAEGAADQLSKVKGIKSVDDGTGGSETEYHYVVNKTKAMEKGLTVAQIYAGISDALTYEDTATTVTWDDEDYDVAVASDQKEKVTPSDLKNLKIKVTGSSGKETEIKVTDVASIQKKQTLKSISRDDQKRYITVTAQLKDGYNVTKVTAAAEKAMAKYDLPKGVTTEFAGENETIMDSMHDLLLMLILGIVFVYLIMVAQFQSLKSPFIIMFTIPLAFTGGLLALLLTGEEISVLAMIGMIMLVGIIVNNGIVLVDCINQLRAGGMPKKEAIVEAGMMRMRPILMTSLTTILGLIVMAIGKTAGTDMMQPVAVVCIGGLLYATLLTLFIVPIMYDLMNGEKYKVLKEEDLEVPAMGDAAY